MTRTLTLLVLGCLLLTGAAVAAIWGRDSLPMIASASAPAMSAPVTNRSGKTDRLQPATLLAALPPVDGVAADQLRQAFANEAASEVAASQPVTEAAPATTALPPVVVPQPAARPKAAAVSDAKNAAHRNYTLLSDAQISAIKGRLNLTPSQEAYWPDIETALRAVAKKMHTSRQASGNAAPLDPDSAEVQQLKSAAMPLLFQLREDQKREVRNLARIIGLEKVAAAI